MTVNAIVAHDEAYGIGKDNKLPWPKNDMDMKWFRECTMGHVVIMGRKTWESLGSKKLPGRTNIVVTSSEIEGEPDCKYNGDMAKLISMIKADYPDLKIWIIGGAETYKQALPFCENIFVTKIKGVYDCDAFLDMNDYLSNYIEGAKKDFGTHSFSIWVRYA